jgi:acetylornithine deacetylase/succinyl-diaminopimelate desuccinylase-like protein
MSLSRPVPALLAASALLLSASPLAASAAPAARLSPPPADQALGRALLKELIEIDTQHDKGSTVAANAVAARLRAAGFADADIAVLAPADHPTKGNVVVRLRGQGKARPILYICHLDVVNARREDWTTDPFKLVEKDGWFYGRGTIDMKSQDAATLESVIRLKREGFKPKGDIIVAFTADEEAGGDANGVDWLVKTHRDLVDAALVINPDGGEAGIKHGKKLYMGVQTSEKIYVTYGLEVTDKGGHSSRPTPANPIFHLSGALARLGAYRFPVHVTDTARLYFAGRAKLESGQVAADMVSMASGTPDPAAVERLSQNVETNIIFRTTCTATEISGGHAESALPQRARATIQCRVIPGEPLDGIKAQLIKVLDEPGIKVTDVYPGDASPESPPAPKLLKTIEAVKNSMWPDAVLLPLMSPGATDSAFTRLGGMPSYGVDASWDDLDDGRAHGQDERISVTVFDEEVEFTYRLMKALASGQ